MGTVISNEQFGQAFGTFKHTAFRLELQTEYNEPSETEVLDRYRAGDVEFHLTVPDFQAWYAGLRQMRAEGRIIQRVRVQEDPPTWYQQWERHVGRWNVEAGEDIRYMTRAKAHEIGLLPAAGDQDWWLFDSTSLIVMTFDEQHRRIRNELVTDPRLVVQACGWRDLALHHSAPDGSATA